GSDQGHSGIRLSANAPHASTSASSAALSCTVSNERVTDRIFFCRNSLSRRVTVSRDVPITCEMSWCVMSSWTRVPLSTSRPFSAIHCRRRCASFSGFDFLRQLARGSGGGAMVLVHEAQEVVAADEVDLRGLERL